MSIYRPRSSGISLTQIIGSLHGRVKNPEEGDRQRFEHLQLQSAQKILTPIECQPKEKHIRNIIIGTFHEEGSYLFWNLIATGFQLETNYIVSWKFCYLFHRILRDGHKNVLLDSQNVTSYIQQLGVFWHSLSNYYGPMLEKYCTLLSTKLIFHDKHRFFPGNFQIEFKDFRQYVGDSSDAYFEISADVMDYLDCLLNLQHIVHASIHQDGTFSHTAAGQCRLRPLVCCIQEANSLYDLLVKMLFEMHTVISPGDLEGHRIRFKNIFNRLREFYNMSSSYKFLKDLMVIPMLTSQPNFKVKEDINNYRPPVCSLNNFEEYPEIPGSIAKSPESQSYQYQVSESWINVSSNQNAENSGGSSCHPVVTESISNQDNSQEDLLSLEVSNDILASDEFRSNVSTVYSELSSPLKVPPVISAENNTEIQTLKSSLSEKDQLIRSLQTRVLILEAAHSSTISNDQKQIDEMNKKLATTEEKYEKMKELYANLRDKHVAVLHLVDAQKTSQVKKVNIEVQTDETPNEDMPTIELNKELRERVRLLEDEKLKIRKEASDLSVKTLKIENQLRQSDAEIEVLKTQNAELEKRLIDPETDDNLKKENESLSEKCKNLERQLMALTDHKSKLSNVLEMNRSNIAMIRETKLEMEANLIDAIHEKNHFEQCSRELQKEIEKQNHLIASLKSKFAELWENESEMIRDSRRLFCDDIISQCCSCLHKADNAEDIAELAFDCIKYCVTLEITGKSLDTINVLPLVKFSCCISNLLAYHNSIDADEEELLNLSTSVSELLLLAQYDSGERFKQVKFKVLTKLEQIFEHAVNKCTFQETAVNEFELNTDALKQQIDQIRAKVSCEQSQLLLKSIEAYLGAADFSFECLIASKYPRKYVQIEKDLSSSLDKLLLFFSSGEVAIYSEFLELQKALWSIESCVWLLSKSKEQVLFDKVQNVIEAASALLDKFNPLFKHKAL